MARRKKLTPAERWDRTADPDELFDLLTGDGKRGPTAAAFARKMRLLETGRVWLALQELPDAELRAALAVADRLTDGPVRPGELRATRATVWRVQKAASKEFLAVRNRHPNGGPGADLSGAQRAAHRSAIAGALMSALGEQTEANADRFQFSLLIPHTAWNPWGDTPDEVYETARTRLCGFVRDVFGNPFAPPVAFDPKWHTSAVTGLANTIYEDRAFDRLPVLADALEEAGCADKRILAHCREPGEHVRGCWVIDGLSGRNWAPRSSS